ncbi:hypothetical protein HMPREF1870_01572 [Bacteroidales bacterium KA00344]|nr:hypothetical protein HMPREF1870_01572 [Bacteroidales bacterium KA00344]
MARRRKSILNNRYTVEIIRQKTLTFFLTNTPLNFAYLKIKTNRFEIREN